MIDLNNPCLIGVDGGGTSCRIAAISKGQRYEVVLGNANVATDRDAALATLRSGLTQVLAQAGLAYGDLRHCNVYMGLAGVMSPQDSASIEGAFDAAHITVSSDRDLALPGALGDADGAVASIGTGSFVGRRAEGKTRFVGGWGFVLDDAASGAWLGSSALRETLRALDGFHSTTPLTKDILADFAGSDADLVAFSLTASPAEFAAFAPRVVAAAGQGDPVAETLMATGADYITNALAVLGWQPGQALCLIGGLGPQYVAYLPKAVVGSIKDPVGNGLDGALELAAKLGPVGKT